jgi:amino acid transporter
MSFAGVGTKGNGLGNPSRAGDVLSPLGSAIFGTSTFGSFLSHLLLLMVLSSAAASTQTTILPTARTTLSMAVYKALPPEFAKMHPRYQTPTFSTIAMGAVSIVLYVFMNYISGGAVIADAVTGIGLYIAFYYGLTAFACVWYYRSNLRSSARNLWMQGILPGLGGFILYFLGGFSVWENYDVKTENDYTMWTVPFIHWQVGGAFVIIVVTALVGLAAYLACRISNPAFFRKQTLTRATPTLVPDE